MKEKIIMKKVEKSTKKKSDKYSVASYKKRFLSFLLDSLFIAAPMAAIAFIYALFQIVAFFFGVGNFSDNQSSGVSALIGALFLLSALALPIAVSIYQLYLIHMTGQTWGKKRMKIKIINLETKENVSALRYILRTLLYPIFAFIFSAILKDYAESLTFLLFYGWIFIEKDNRGIHDIITKTVVVEN